MKSKFSSRKFLTALIAESAGIITTITGLIAALLGSGHPAVIITGALLTVLSGVAYCIVEGRLDEQSIRTSGAAVAGVADALGADKIGDLIEGATNSVAGVIGEKTMPADGEGEGDGDDDEVARKIGF